MRRAVGKDASPRVAELIGHRDQLWILDDLEWERHVGRAWNARHVTSGFSWIGARPLLKIFLLLGERGGLIWNFAALDHTLPRRYTQGGIVIFKIPCSGVQNL